MKLLHVVPTYLPAYRYGGAIYSVHGLCKGLARAGHEVTVFTTNVDGLSNSKVPLLEPVDQDGVKIEYFPSRFMRRLYYSPPMREALYRRCRHFDIVHLHSVFLWPTWEAARASRYSRIPYIVSPRGMLVHSLVQKKNPVVKSLWLRWVEKTTIENAAAVHATSDLELRQMLDFKFNFPPIYVIPNGTEAVFSPMEAGLSNSIDGILKKHDVILFLGRINWKKGLDRLIPAMSYVKEATLAVVGNDEEGYRPFLEKLACEKGVEGRVIFLGPVYGESKLALFKHASLFVLPSYSENFGNAVLEAMAAGCPVVVTPEVGLSDAVKDLKAGIVVSGEPRILGEKLRELMADRTLLAEMGQRGKKAASESFNWSRIAEQMVGVYSEMIRKKSESTENS